MIDPVGSVLKGYFENGRIIEEDSKSYLVEGVGKNNIPGCFNPKLVISSLESTNGQAKSYVGYATNLVPVLWWGV